MILSSPILAIVTHCFQGKVRIESQQVFVRSGLEEEFGIEELNHPDNPKNKEENKLDSDGRKEGGQEDEFGNVKFNIDRGEFSKVMSSKKMIQNSI